MFLHLPLDFITDEMREEIEARQDDKLPIDTKSVATREIEIFCDGGEPISKDESKAYYALVEAYFEALEIAKIVPPDFISKWDKQDKDLLPYTIYTDYAFLVASNDELRGSIKKILENINHG